MTNPPRQLITLIATDSEFEAEAIVSALRAQGIAATAQGGTLSGFRAEAPAQVQVLVHAGQADDARAVLRAIKSKSIDLDWDQLVHEAEQPTDDPTINEVNRRPLRRAPRRSRSRDVRQGYAAVALLLAGLLTAFAIGLPFFFTLLIGLGCLLAVIYTLVQMAIPAD